MVVCVVTHCDYCDYRDQLSLLELRTTVPFMPIHLKDILFAIEGCRASIENKQRYNVNNFQLIATCLASLILRHNYAFAEDPSLRAYLEVRVSGSLVL